MKKFIVVALALIITLLIVVFFSANTVRYECLGSFKHLAVKQGEPKIFLVYSDYRFWTKLWTSSDGDLKAEIPGYWLQYYGYVQNTGEKDGHLHFYDNKNEGLSGYFSLLSKHLWLKIGPQDDIFEGSCREVK